MDAGIQPRWRPAPMCPHFLFETSKRKRPHPVKRKNVRRVGLRGADLLPPARDRWLFLAAIRDGNAIPLGNPLARGNRGYMQLLFSLPLTLPRRTSQRQRKEEQRPCVDRPGEVNTHHRGARPVRLSCPARAGRRPTSLVSTGSEDPRQRGGPLHRSAAKKRFSLWTVHGPFLFWQDKREMGGAMDRLSS